MNRHTLPVLLAVLALGCEPRVAVPTITGRVIKIVDGDKADILQADKTIKRIRLASFDAPERGQPFGKNATKYLAELIAGETITVKVQDTDRYDRSVCEVFDDDGQRVAIKLVAAGLAWHYVKFAPNDIELAKAEIEAREAKRGLWSDPRFVPPWDWRDLTKEERDQLR